ncbi:MAG: DUF2905 domain-containing protein [Oligoflexia bacterium]|nr:DUF2905 domain-containing protein [Oligoflexia bacterium]
MPYEVGKWLYFGGITLILLGAIINNFPQLLTWFGKLPGDIRIQGEKVTFYFPVVSMLLLSLGFSLILTLVLKFFGPQD